MIYFNLDQINIIFFSHHICIRKKRRIFPPITPYKKNKKETAVSMINEKRNTKEKKEKREEISEKREKRKRKLFATLRRASCTPQGGGPRRRSFAVPLSFLCRSFVVPFFFPCRSFFSLSFVLTCRSF